MAVIKLAGRQSASSGAVIDNVAALIWNPHATVRVQLREIHIANSVATVAHIGVKRTTTRGATPAASFTAAIANADQRDIVDPAGIALEVAGFGTQPAVEGSYIERWAIPAAIGAGVMFVFADPLTIPAGTGLAIVSAAALLTPIMDYSLVYEV